MTAPCPGCDLRDTGESLLDLDVFALCGPCLGLHGEQLRDAAAEFWTLADDMDWQREAR